MARNLGYQISVAIEDYLDICIGEHINDKLCHDQIANELDLDEIVSHLDIDHKFDEAIADWLDKNFDTIAEQYANTAEYIVRGLAEARAIDWLNTHAHRFEPLHRRCWRWLKSVNWKFWRKK